MNYEVKDLIKQKLDIVDVISEYVTLIPAGSNYKALSPFRNEKTPSFIVSPELQIYKDFGGDKSGDIFQFIMDIEGVDFRESLQILSEKSGIPINSQYSYTSIRGDNKKQSLNILNDSKLIYISILNHLKYGQNARQYLYDRGISPKLIELFQIGLAPQNYQILTKKLLKKYSVDEIEASGMGIRAKQNHIYDRFRGRVMIPIQDTLGRVVGFTGRVLPDYDDGKMGKYVNSPQTNTFDKSKVLFGLFQAKSAIKKNNRVILVEGQMDVIMSHEAGIAETVAVSGTALTEYHIKILLRYTNYFFLAFDADSAGVSACLRSAGLITKMGGIVKVIYMSDGKDPADLVRQDPNLWIKAIGSAEDFIDYYINHIVNNIDSSDIPSKNQALKKLIDWIQVITDPIGKNYYVKKLADALNMAEKDIYAQIKTVTNMGLVEQPISVVDSVSSKLQKHLIAYLLYKPQNHDILILDQSLFTQSKLKSLFIKLRDYCSQHTPTSLSLSECRQFLSNDEYNLLESILLPIFYQIEETKSSPEQLDQTIQENIRLLKLQYKSSVRKALLRQLKEAKKSGDSEKVKEILKKYQKFTQNIR